MDNPFAPYTKHVGEGALAATLEFEHYDGEWSSMIRFDDNRFNRGEIILGREVFRAWVGPTAPNIIIEQKATAYWQDLCDLINRAAEIFGQ